MLSLIAATTTLLPLLTSALPTTLHPRTPTATQYEITNLKTHFMGSNSGIANGDWPPSSVFNSTLELVVQYPSTDYSSALPDTTTCTGSWPYGTHPEAWIPCADGSVGWRFVEFESEGRFVVEVGRKTGETTADTGSVSVTSNNLSDDSSWLTCLGGPPLDGIRCTLNGMMSKQKAPIPVAVAAGPALDF